MSVRLEKNEGGADELAMTPLVVNIRTGQSQALQGHTGMITSMAFSADGKRVITGSTDKTVRIWDAAAGRQLHKLVGHPDRIKCVAFSPSGKVMMTVSRLTAVLSDVGSGKELARLRHPPPAVIPPTYTVGGRTIGYVYEVKAAAFSPDGAYVLTACYDDIARVWDVASGKEVASSDRVASRSRPWPYRPTARICSSARPTARHASGTWPRARKFGGSRGTRPASLRWPWLPTANAP